MDDEGATDGADVSEVEGTEETDGAEQPEQSDESEEPQTPPESEKFKLKYMGEEIEVSRDEVIQLAQEG